MSTPLKKNQSVPTLNSPKNITKDSKKTRSGTLEASTATIYHKLATPHSPRELEFIENFDDKHKELFIEMKANGFTMQNIETIVGKNNFNSMTPERIRLLFVFANIKHFAIETMITQSAILQIDLKNLNVLLSSTGKQYLEEYTRYGTKIDISDVMIEHSNFMKGFYQHMRQSLSRNEIIKANSEIELPRQIYSRGQMALQSTRDDSVKETTAILPKII